MQILLNQVLLLTRVIDKFLHVIKNNCIYKINILLNHYNYQVFTFNFFKYIFLYCFTDLLFLPLASYISSIYHSHKKTDTATYIASESDLLPDLVCFIAQPQRMSRQAKIYSSFVRKVHLLYSLDIKYVLTLPFKDYFHLQQQPCCLQILCVIQQQLFFLII